MKKILSILLLLTSSYYVQAQGRTLTINNTTSCSVKFLINGMTGSPACSASYCATILYSLAGGSSVSYSSFSSLSWVSTPPTTDWYSFQVCDYNYPTCHLGVGDFVQGTVEYCPPLPHSSSFFSCTCGTTINYSWVDDPKTGNVTCTIY